MRDFRSDRYNNNRPRRDFVGQSGSIATQMVNKVFREPIHQVLEKIKNKSFNKIDGDFDDVAIRTFKVSLPTKHGLRKSLIGKPASGPN